MRNTRAIAIGAAAAVVFGLVAPVNANPVEPGNTWVHQDDLAAARWLRANTPANARIHGGVFSFGYSPDWVLASDAAYWMPLLAGRPSIILPMIYDIERTTQPTLDVDLSRLNALQNNVLSDDAIGVLRELGVRYIYIGARGSAIQPADLRASPHFREAFTSGAASIFELTP